MDTLQPRSQGDKRREPGHEADELDDTKAVTNLYSGMNSPRCETHRGSRVNAAYREAFCIARFHPELNRQVQF